MDVRNAPFSLKEWQRRYAQAELELAERRLAESPESHFAARWRAQRAAYAAKLSKMDEGTPAVKPAEPADEEGALPADADEDGQSP